MARRCLGVLVVALVVAGCGGNDGEVRNLGEGATTSSSVPGGTSTSTAGSGAGGCHVEGGLTTKGQDLVVTLDEWSIEPAAAEAPAGIVSFIAENTGAEPHELVIVKGDRAEALPTDPDTGAMDEAQLPEGGLVGEIESFPPGQLCRGNFALEAGSYVLLCNIVEKEPSGESESHFAEGMHTTFTVKAS